MSVRPRGGSLSDHGGPANAAKDAVSTVVQLCARCGARWAVYAAPMHWCPRCRGVLLSPAPIDAPVDRRNYRWVARRPDHRTRPRVARTAPSPATPRYEWIPRWGLIEAPAKPMPAPRHPLDWLASRATALLVATSAVFALAACAELGRYLILLRNRARLIDLWLLRASDAFVVGFSGLALVLGLVTALALLGWLVEVRRAAYARAGRRDPRSVRMLALGCLIPVANLLWPGVFLTEAVAKRGDPRAVRAIRVWWSAWFAGGACAIAALAWRTADSLQTKADGVSFTALTDAVAAGVALLTLWVMRVVEGRDLQGRPRNARRWVIAVDPAAPVIEPVHPGAAPPDPGATDPDAGGAAASDEDRDTGAPGERGIDSGASDREQEVVAK